MAWWNRNTPTYQVNTPTYSMPEPQQNATLSPVLLTITVEPVMYGGEAIKHKLIMKFDTGELVLGMAQNADGLQALRLEMMKEIKLPE